MEYQKPGDQQQQFTASPPQYSAQPNVVYQPMQAPPQQPYFVQGNSGYSYAVNWGTGVSGNTVIVVPQQNGLQCSEAEYTALKDRAICLGWVSLFCGALYCSIPALIMAYKDRATVHDLQTSTRLSTAAIVCGLVGIVAAVLLILFVTGVIGGLYLYY